VPFNIHGGRFKGEQEQTHLGPGLYNLQENQVNEDAIRILNSENLKHYVKLNVNQKRIYQDLQHSDATMSRAPRFQNPEPQL